MTDYKDKKEEVKPIAIKANEEPKKVETEARESVSKSDAK